MKNSLYVAILIIFGGLCYFAGMVRAPNGAVISFPTPAPPVYPLCYVQIGVASDDSHTMLEDKITAKRFRECVEETL